MVKAICLFLLNAAKSRGLDSYVTMSVSWTLPTPFTNAAKSNESEFHGCRFHSLVQNDSSTGSFSNMQLASLWLNTCTMHHSQCAVTKPFGQFSKLPTRVLDVSDPHAPFLYETQNHQFGIYVALSYAWGDAPRVVTLQSNRTAFQQRIPVATLPRTFQDAIFVTHSLRITYLWIDALCIVQDLADDVEQEMGVMGGIYRDAAVTLVAEHGVSTAEGLFVDWNPRANRPCKLDVMATSEDEDREIRLWAYVPRSKEDWAPLYDRGWVLQEEILSGRALIFGRKGMSWRCIEGDADECHPGIEMAGGLFVPSYDPGYAKLRLWIFDPSSMCREEEQEQGKAQSTWRGGSSAKESYYGGLFGGWRQTVEQYSLRTLTYWSDELPAISGLAGLVADAHNCAYLGGLWREDLHRGLLWYVAVDSAIRKRLVPDASAAPRRRGEARPLVSWPGYVAPSWSWASAAGLTVAHRFWPKGSTFVPEQSAQVIDAVCHLAPDAKNPFGKLVGGYLKLKAPLKKAILQPCPSEDGKVGRYRGNYRSQFERHRWTAAVLDAETKRIVGDAAMDMQSVEPVAGGADKFMDLSMTVWCLLLTTARKDGEYQVSGLVLAPTREGANEYQRIGLLFLGNMAWFREMGSSTVGNGADSQVEDIAVTVTVI